MNSIWTHRRVRVLLVGVATLVTGAVLASAAFAGFRALELGPAAASEYPGQKVTVCHHTGSKTNPWVEITISVNALKAHVGHHDGDFVVTPATPCPPTTLAPATSKHAGKHLGKGKKRSRSTVAKFMHDAAVKGKAHGRK
jgi:hypothetical protein